MLHLNWWTAIWTLINWIDDDLVLNLLTNFTTEFCASIKLPKKTYDKLSIELNWTR